jgi:hypothetical protein
MSLGWDGGFFACVSLCTNYFRLWWVKRSDCC